MAKTAPYVRRISFTSTQIPDSTQKDLASRMATIDSQLTGYGHNAERYWIPSFEHVGTLTDKTPSLQQHQLNRYDNVDRLAASGCQFR